MIDLDFNKGNGLLPAIVQDYQTGKVLMLAYLDKASWRKTLETGEAHYWSRSRQEIWHKGETSGHIQVIKEILVDCDQDTVLFRVEQVGGVACHTGHVSCFYRKLGENSEVVTVEERIFDPEKVYGK